VAGTAIQETRGLYAREPKPVKPDVEFQRVWLPGMTAGGIASRQPVPLVAIASATPSLLNLCP